MNETLTQQQMDDIVFYKARKQSVKRIASLVKASESVIAKFIDGLPKKEKPQPARDTDPTPEEIEAACKLLRQQQQRYPRYEGAREQDTKRMPRHFAAVPDVFR